MPAPKGNRYGEKYWIRPIGEEEFAMVGVRLPKSQIARGRNATTRAGKE
jgi:hypothetical protein